MQYCQACKRLAVLQNLSLRDLDRALWGRSWEKGVRAFCEELREESTHSRQNRVFLAYHGIGQALDTVTVIAVAFPSLTCS